MQPSTTLSSDSSVHTRRAIVLALVLTTAAVMLGALLPTAVWRLQWIALSVFPILGALGGWRAAASHQQPPSGPRRLAWAGVGFGAAALASFAIAWGWLALVGAI